LFTAISLSAYTTVHVALSLVAIAAGVVVLLHPSRTPRTLGLTTLFLATTLAGNVTGLLYLVAFPRFGMGHAIGIASLVVFAPTLLALRRPGLDGRWRPIWVAGATTLLYLNAFIAVMQAFSKVGFLRGLPATTVGSPLLFAHLLLVAACLWLGLHAFAALQSGPRRLKPRRPRPLRVADRWG
jgi:hypothetical protein